MPAWATRVRGHHRHEAAIGSRIMRLRFIAYATPLPSCVSTLPAGLWSYIVIADLARACVLAATAALPAPNSHEVVYIAADDNAGGRDLAAAVSAYYGEGVIPQKGALWRPDASGIRCDKAKALLGWSAQLSWRDFLDAKSGALLPGMAEGTAPASFKALYA